MVVSTDFIGVLLLLLHYVRQPRLHVHLLYSGLHDVPCWHDKGTLEPCNYWAGPAPGRATALRRLGIPDVDALFFATLAARFNLDLDGGHAEALDTLRRNAQSQRMTTTEELDNIVPDDDLEEQVAAMKVSLACLVSMVNWPVPAMDTQTSRTDRAVTVVLGIVLERCYV